MSSVTGWRQKGVRYLCSCNFISCPRVSSTGRRLVPLGGTRAGWRVGRWMWQDYHACHGVGSWITGVELAQGKTGWSLST